MAANIDTMIYVGETPWHRQGRDLTLDPPKSSSEIVAAAELGWRVNSTPMYTALHNSVPSWNAIYREDNNEILGVINKARPIIVQNTDSFNAVNNLIGKELDVETAASLGRGETVFGCFKIREQYRILDDDIDHYFVIVNDHLRPDGKVTILNTPIRVVCQNTLSEALNTNIYKLRVPISADTQINSHLAVNLIETVGTAIDSLQKKAEDMVSKKIDKVYMDKLLDVLFPYQLVDGAPLPTKANETVSIVRETFVNQCMGADNLNNYRGTQWQIFNALTDFQQHFHKSADKAYDINHRMSLVPGIKSATETSKVVQFLKIADKLAA